MTILSALYLQIGILQKYLLGILVFEFKCFIGYTYYPIIHRLFISNGIIFD